MAKKNSTPAIYPRINGDGSTSFLAQVFVAPFDRVSKKFNELKHGGKKAARIAAEEWWQRTDEELREQLKSSKKPRAELSTITLGEIILLYLADPKTKRLRTYDDTHRLLCWWKDYYGATRAGECDSIIWFEGRDRLYYGRKLMTDNQTAGEVVEPVRAEGTVNRYLSAMRGCWSWARIAHYIKDHQRWPEKGLMLDEPKSRTRFLSDDERKSLLAVARDFSPAMLAAIKVSLGCGIRQGELLRLDWADVDFAGETLSIHITKNDQPRKVHLPQEAADALRTLRRGVVRAIGGPVFIMDDGTRIKKSTLESRWNVVRERAGLVDFKWHDLRHSCASILAQEGSNLTQIGEVLGHKSPAVTKKYVHFVQGAPLPAHARLNEKLRG